MCKFSIDGKMLPWHCRLKSMLMPQKSCCTICLRENAFKLVVVPLLKHDLKDSLLHLLINGAVCILYPFADFPDVVIREVVDVLPHSCFPLP